MSETQTTRLIDANALIEMLFARAPIEECKISVALVKSAPTVETTVKTVDNVLARLPKEYGKRWLTIGANDDGTFFAGYAEILEDERQDSYQKIELGDSFLEAVKKLEELLNQK